MDGVIGGKCYMPLQSLQHQRRYNVQLVKFCPCYLFRCLDASAPWKLVKIIRNKLPIFLKSVFQLPSLQPSDFISQSFTVQFLLSLICSSLILYYLCKVTKNASLQPSNSHYLTACFWFLSLLFQSWVGWLWFSNFGIELWEAARKEHKGVQSKTVWLIHFTFRSGAILFHVPASRGTAHLHSFAQSNL